MKAIPAQSKDLVRSYWNSRVCETDEYWKETNGTSRLDTYRPGSQKYFEAIEQYRYQTQADIFAFAQFTRYHGKRVLEIGVGAGTDFLQWVRAGADTFGVDLTEAAIEMTSRRLAEYGLKCHELRVADAENLPFADGFFDLVYSWGVLHHTPDTVRAIEEIIRVTRPGGTIKLMLYNRRSLVGVKQWIQHALLKGKPFQSLTKIFYYNTESLGTKAYTPEEVRRILRSFPIANLQIDAAATPRELGPPSSPTFAGVAKYVARYLLTLVLGIRKADVFMKIEFDRI